MCIETIITPAQKQHVQTNFRIPVDSSWPGTYWIVSLSQDSQMPTDPELTQIKSYCEFVVRRWYNETYQNKILVERDLPADAGHNTTILYKSENGHWCYRRMTWQMGFWPHPFNPYGKVPATLVDLLDHIQSCGGREDAKWVQWKAEHPEIF